jgi:hypothetical protein
VSPERIQAVEVAIVAFLFAFAVVALSRKGQISFRYTIGWLTLSALTAFGGLLLPVIEPLSNKVRLDAFSLVSALSVIVLLGLCIQLSISISGIQIQLRLLNEELAIQKNQLDELNDLQK